MKFHIELILGNKTTIEYIEHKGEHFESVYDISPLHNWRQVFGYNQLLWFFPVFCASGHPVGDGVYWPINHEIKARLGQNIGTQSIPAQSQPNNVGESQRILENNDSHKSELNDTPVSKNSNKENVDNIQRENGHSYDSKGSKDSRDSHIKFDPNFGQNNARNLETVVNRKDGNNTLIVHSQDNRKMLKNTIIKSNF